MKGLKYNFFVIFLFASSTATYAQTATDSSFHSHLKQYNIKEETVVTATRTERKLSNVAIPTKIITQKSIKQAGSMRLSDILQEQSGLFLTSGFGTGVQMQGLNPDYTLIMINGEPLVGRTSGVLDLNRLAVGNIKKIEIVKGPSSSLYGSEAMAGVINIITDQTFNDFKLHIEFRYPEGSNSGVYLRGRYEIQVEDNRGQEPLSTFFGGIYGFITPNEMAAKAPGEWQTYDVTLVGRRVTVVANGKKIITDQIIPGITGGALDSKEGEPGPIMLQGDHGPVEYRNIIITPAK